MTMITIRNNKSHVRCNFASSSCLFLFTLTTILLRHCCLPFSLHHHNHHNHHNNHHRRRLLSVATPSSSNDKKNIYFRPYHRHIHHHASSKDTGISTSEKQTQKKKKKNDDEILGQKVNGDNNDVVCDDDDSSHDDYETKSSSSSSSPFIRADDTTTSTTDTNSTKLALFNNDRKISLMWCDHEACTDVLRERVVGDHNQIIINGPATGQVAYRWNRNCDLKSNERSIVTHASVLLLVKPQDEYLIEKAAEAVPKMTHAGIEVLLFAELAAVLKYNYGVDDKRIKLFEPPKKPSRHSRDKHVDDPEECWINEIQFHHFPDLICTLGGDGLLMFASNLFQGAVPPIISIAGGSLGFLTPFTVDEMVDALQTALGIEKSVPSSPSSVSSEESPPKDGDDYEEEDDDELGGVFPPNMAFPMYEPSPHVPNHGSSLGPKFLFGMGDLICMTIRMRLDCRIVNPEGIVRSRYNVLNELVIDRGSSPYLSALECYCDDQHLTTVQADGIIFATPTGSTAYSMSAGGSVVHPAVPCILVTPICPHVLSFRSMVFPDHVVLRCYVPDDARSTASVAFDGKHRQEIQRGDSVQIQMSSYPVPTINRGDNSADWLDSLKRSFNFNTRPRQRPLE